MITEARTPGVAPKATGIKLSKAEMDERDQRILKAFIGGASEREIGRSVGLTGQRIHAIIRRELKRGTRHRQMLAEQALDVYISRLDVMLKATWPKAATGDIRAIDLARRLCEQEARALGVGAGAGAAVSVPASTDLEFDPDDPDEMNELERYRRKYTPRGGDH